MLKVFYVGEGTHLGLVEIPPIVMAPTALAAAATPPASPATLLAAPAKPAASYGR